MQLTSADERLLTQITAALEIRRHATLGVAVSGGGDSMALLHLLVHLRARWSLKLSAITVDHGLRDGAAAEAQFVAKACDALGIPHVTRRWQGWDGRGNLQDAARQARYRMISDWAVDTGCDSVCLGHTQDDVAETFLMRLGRASGVDGLATMARQFERAGMRYLRPLLTMSRDELRAFLRRHQLEWCEDPSNENDMFQRVRARKALAGLAPLGITAETLAQVAANMTDVSAVMLDQLRALAQTAVSEDNGDLLIENKAFGVARFELRRRLLLAALNWIQPSPYPQRRSAVQALDAAIAEGRVFSLGGCLIQPGERQFRVMREYNAVRDLVEHSPAWDRWHLTGYWQVGMQVRALGEPALAVGDNWRDSGLPRRSLMASPALWQDGRLIAAPLAGMMNGWQATLKSASFQDSLARGDNYRIEPR
ncbi:tRNA lysidine(34) synthetase TilS [Cognatishimia sp. SS12]|uniref:tRNA lysidine(34) synthetase TilS n=1 Tax=Cognatishimia sp. SS12 TaxID=2979465 RepID=UPI00232E2E64|nr:tRNA lysidine(34) synthetase TilS [Cognatishimia sp. SS12]MDC0738777.1 tRNA lysidine(34) synthetase TilS [Cognatishimia sp. SS12]